MSRTSKFASLAILVSTAAGIWVASPAAHAGTARIGTITVKDVRVDWVPRRSSAEVASLLAQPNPATTIPTFTATAHDGTSTFSYTMVGKNPFVPQTKPSTTVKTLLIPAVVKFSNGDKWDPRAIDSCDSRSALTRTKNSPIFVAQHWKFGGTRVGRGQYIDAFQRSEFFNQTKPAGINPHYHVKLALTVHAPLVLNVPDADAAEARTVCGNGKLGGVQVNYLDAQLRNYITSKLGPTATRTFPLFLLGNVVAYTTTSQCCVLGYHSAMTNAGNLQTYAFALYDNSGDFRGSADTAVLSHEVGEWVNDPTGFNITKPWHNPSLPFCQLNLEVGDPLTGTVITDRLNGKSYHLQELAFSSWFYHASPSLGVNGWYSSNGTFTTSAAPCP